MTNNSDNVINDTIYPDSIPASTASSTLNSKKRSFGLPPLRIPSHHPKAASTAGNQIPEFYGAMSSEDFKKKAPELRNWKDANTYPGVSIQVLDNIKLFDCIDLIPLSNGKHIHLADIVAANRFVVTNPNAFQVNLMEGPFQIRDDGFHNILKHIQNHHLFELITDALDCERPVIVNCHAGISRSTSIVIAYLMWAEHSMGLTPQEPGKHAANIMSIRWGVNGSRQRVLPNSEFMQNLIVLHRSLSGLPELTLTEMSNYRANYEEIIRMEPLTKEQHWLLEAGRNIPPPVCAISSVDLSWNSPPTSD
jgi:hypothetical protein